MIEIEKLFVQVLFGFPWQIIDSIIVKFLIKQLRTYIMCRWYMYENIIYT